MIKRFEDLIVWQSGMDIAKQVYAISNDGELSKDRGLRDQMRRSAVSIPSNIAEGFERKSGKEYVRFLIIAKGSCGELRTQLILTKELYNIDIQLLYDQCVVVSKQLQSLINKIHT